MAAVESAVELRVALIRHGDGVEGAPVIEGEPFVDVCKKDHKTLLMLTEKLCEFEHSCLMAFFSNECGLCTETARIVTKAIGREGEEMPLAGLSGEEAPWENVVDYLQRLKIRSAAVMVMVGDAETLCNVAAGLEVNAPPEKFPSCGGVLLERRDGVYKLGEFLSTSDS